MPVSSGSSALYNLIRDRILQSPDQRLTFAAFMDLALYHPTYGYYSASNTQLGPTGDFVTSVHMGQDFGELLAVQLVEMWERLNRPHPFHVVEMGPGQGLLANAILTYCQEYEPDCWAAMQYTLIEKSPALATAQRDRLQSWIDQGVALRWCTLADLAPDAVIGCCFSNELVDALPVHRVVLTADGLQEQYVTLHPDGTFTTTVGALSTPALLAYFKAVGIDCCHPPYPLGYTTEVNLAAIAWLETIASKLHQGYLMTIDYGYEADRYYSPLRSQGTLQCYYRHAHHDDPLINLGQQDITAHVDFTALAQYGETFGLTHLGTQPQELFLMALGLGDRLNALSQIQETDGATLRYVLQRRESLHQLINPLGVGKFTVLIQGKGLTQASQRQLRGFTIPPMS